MQRRLNILVDQTPPGAGMDFNGSTLPKGWLWQDGTAYDPSAYPRLFKEIGYIHGRQGDKFKVPDSRGRSSIGAGTGSGLTNRNLGQSGGLESVALNITQSPSHVHTIDDGGHNHAINETAHSHGAADPGHAHGVSDSGHIHAVYDPGHGHILKLNTKGSVSGGGYPVDADLESLYDYAVERSSTGVNLYAAGANIGIYGATANISISGTKTNVSLNGANTNISMNAQGGGQGHENMSPWIAANKIIKY